MDRDGRNWRERSLYVRQCHEWLAEVKQSFEDNPLQQTKGRIMSGAGDFLYKETISDKKL